MSMFQPVKDLFLERFPGGGDVVFLVGSTTRVISFVMILFAVVLVCRMIARPSAHNQAFSITQAFTFFGTAIALHAPYSKIPYANWDLIVSVAVCLLVQALVMIGLRVTQPSVHKAMMNGNMGAGVAYGMYVLGAGIGTNAVLMAKL